MTVSGMNINSYYNNSYRINSKPEEIQTTEAADKVVIRQENAGDNLSDSNKTSQDTRKAPVDTDPNAFAFDFGSGIRFNLVAATSSMEDVDIEKAVSEMKKDTVLSQYKFFVGTTNTGTPNLGTDADGSVRLVSR